MVTWNVLGDWENAIKSKKNSKSVKNSRLGGRASSMLKAKDTLNNENINVESL